MNSIVALYKDSTSNTGTSNDKLLARQGSLPLFKKLQHDYEQRENETML